MKKKDNILMCLFVSVGYLLFCSALPSALSLILAEQFPFDVNVFYAVLSFLTGVIYLVVLFRLAGEQMDLLKNITVDGIMDALIMGFVVFIAVNFFISPFLGSFFRESMGSYTETVDYMGTTPVASFFQLVIIAPFLEEMVFRGFLLKRALRWRNKVVAVLLVAVLFGALHLNLVQSLSAGAAGLIFCIFYAKKESIAQSIVAHSFYNGLAYVLMYVVGGML